MGVALAFWVLTVTAVPCGVVSFRRVAPVSCSLRALGVLLLVLLVGLLLIGFLLFSSVVPF